MRAEKRVAGGGASYVRNVTAVGYLIDWEQDERDTWTSRFGSIVKRGHLWDIHPGPVLIHNGTCAWIVGVYSLQEAFHWFDERVEKLNLL